MQRLSMHADLDSACAYASIHPNIFAVVLSCLSGSSSLEGRKRKKNLKGEKKKSVTGWASSCSAAWFD